MASRHPNIRTTEDQTKISGPGLIGRAPGSGAGAASEISWPDVGRHSTNFLGIYTATQVLALTGMSAGQYVLVSDQNHRKVTYNGSEWTPWTRDVFIHDVTSYTGEFGDDPTAASLGCVLRNGTYEKVNFRGLLHDLCPIASPITAIKAIWAPRDATTDTGNMNMRLIFRNAVIGEYYAVRAVEVNPLYIAVPASNQYIWNSTSLSTTMLSGITNKSILDLYFGRYAGDPSDTYEHDVIFSGVMITYIPDA